MQNSAIYRRGVVVPLSESATHALMENNVTLSTPVEFYRFPDDGEVFHEFWAEGIFRAINLNIGALLDDYEEETIEAFQINVLKEVMIRFQETVRMSCQAKSAVNRIIGLCNIALEHTSPMFFIL